MSLEQHAYYKAVLAHDTRFDGVFFTCVKSTGIYCRPICRAVVPKEENCIFVGAAAKAEKMGYRPCLRCRPELAPAVLKSKNNSAGRLAAHIDETLLVDETLAHSARRFNISVRHLRRQFEEQFGVEPKQYLTTRRLLFAKRLLQDTAMPTMQVAYASGFGSPGRLTINMQKAYGFTPARLRKQGKAKVHSEPLRLRADYRPPFDWQMLLRFISKRATPLEEVANDHYYRWVSGYKVSIYNQPHNNCLIIELPIELSKQAHEILNNVRTLFDLDASPAAISEVLASDPIIGPLLARHPGVRQPGCWDKFEMLLRAVIGQRVSVSAATTLTARLIERVGVTPSAVAKSTPEAIAAIGSPLRQARTIHGIAHAVVSRKIDLEEFDPERFSAQFANISGVGPWTLEYLRLRLLHWPDALPVEDGGLQKAIKPGKRVSPQELVSLSRAWQPWRSYAAMLLWNSLTTTAAIHSNCDRLES